MIKTSDFKPAWWLPGPHLQTVWPQLSKRKHNLPLNRQRLELPDGDFLDLDWLNRDLNTPIIVLLHGLEGSRQSHYIQRVLATLQHLGYRSVLLHFRGCSGEPNRLPRCYHSGETGDINTVIKTLQQHYPNTPLGAIGYSLGGNVLLKWLGETGNQNPLQCAIAVSVPMVLQQSADRMQHGFSRIYQWRLLKKLKRKLQQKQQQITLPFIVDDSANNSFWQFDNNITAPLHGFSDAMDYYRKSSSRQYLKDITVPTLVLHALDDPFTSKACIPSVEELSATVTVELSRHGGHIGFVSGHIPGLGKYWLQQRISTYLQHMLKI